MAYLLNLVYLTALVAALPWLAYARLRYGKYREGWSEKFWGRVPRRDSRGPCVWFHAVSVGEVNLLAPLIERWERQHPAWDCVISTTTQTGYALAVKRYAPRRVFYCPLDFTWAVRRALRRVRPDVLVLTELELWPNLIELARERGIQVAVVNGRLSERSLRGYQRIGWLARRTLSKLNLIAAQDETYAERFRSLGALPECIHVTGSVKFDGAQTDRGNSNTRRLAALAKIAPDDIVFVAGSTQAPEESLALAAFLNLAELHPRLKLIIVPRHPERFKEVAETIDRALAGRPMTWRRRSELNEPQRTDASASAPGPRVLLVDAVGELGAWWGTASVAYVGGSLGKRGGQNMIEPAAYGVPTSFGPNTANFRDVVQLLLARDAAVVVHSGEELQRFVERCLHEPAWAAELGARAQTLVREQLGASDRTIALLEKLARPQEVSNRRTDAVEGRISLPASHAGSPLSKRNNRLSA
jgi:3-deoxy-D-manno-octulosonic-acid transferase